MTFLDELIGHLFPFWAQAGPQGPTHWYYKKRNGVEVRLPNSIRAVEEDEDGQVWALWMNPKTHEWERR